MNCFESTGTFLTVNLACFRTSLYRPPLMEENDKATLSRLRLSWMYRLKTFRDSSESFTIRQYPFTVQLRSQKTDGCYRKYNLYDWTISDWTSILELAHKWEFNEVKSLAIRELEHHELSVMDRIVLYQKYSVDRARLVPLYAELASRPDALDDDESEALGMKTTVLIFRARERLRALPSDGGRSPLPAGLEKEDVHNAILYLLGVPTPVTSPTDDSSGSGSGSSLLHGLPRSWYS